MAILTRAELMSKLQERFGEATDEESLAFIEDVTDTYDAMANKEDAEKLAEMTGKYEDLQRKYRERFFQQEEVVEDNEPADPEPDPEPLRYEDLFTEEE